MKYATELKKFASSQSIYSAVRISLAIVLPSIVLAHFGLLKEYFLFPLATSFIGLTDQAGPFIRRRNALILAIVSFFSVALIASFLKNFPFLIYPEIIVFSIFFTMIGVYGQRLAAVGSLSLVVLAIFIDGHLTGSNIIKSSLIFLAGSIFYLLIFLVVSKIQPYKLAGQMIGENYLELGNYLSLKSKFYFTNPDFEALNSQIISQQISIKNLQEETRETVFETRKIVNESTTTSRLLMLMFLNSIDLHEKLMTSESDYRKVHEHFGNTNCLNSIGAYLQRLSEEMTNIGIALQSNTKAIPIRNIDTMLEKMADFWDEEIEAILDALTSLIEPLLICVLGVIVELAGGSKDLAHDIAVHIAFTKPTYLSRQDVPEAAVASERETLETITRAEGKPEAALEKIVEGRLNGWFKDQVLLEQPFVNDDKQTIIQLLGDATIVQFTQVSIGA